MTREPDINSIKAEMARRGVPQWRIAKHLGISQQTISNRMLGITEFSDEHVAAIAEYLDVPINRITERESETR